MKGSEISTDLEILLLCSPLDYPYGWLIATKKGKTVFTAQLQISIQTYKSTANSLKSYAFKGEKKAFLDLPKLHVYISGSKTWKE